MSTYQDRARELLHNFGTTYQVESPESRKQSIDQALSELASIVEEEIINCGADLDYVTYVSPYSRTTNPDAYWQEHARELELSVRTKVRQEQRDQLSNRSKQS